MKKKSLSASIDPLVHERLVRFAEEGDYYVSNVVEAAIAMFLEKQKALPVRSEPVGQIWKEN